MKKVILLIMIVFIVVLSCACEKEDTNMTDLTTKEIEGFRINNEPVKSDDISYSIKDLKKVFTDSWMNEENGDFLYLSEINDVFGLKYLRKVKDQDAYYIVYPVTEGGKLLVFLCSEVNFEAGVKKLCYSDSMYIHDLPTEDTFDAVDSNYTFDDIKSLAPCTCLVTVLSSSVDSYTLLKDEKVLWCTYVDGENQSLMVHTSEVLSFEDPDSPFKGMVLSDLIE